MKRNFSIEAYFQQVASKLNPRLRFEGSSREQWQEWHDQLLPAVRASLLQMPEKVPLNPEVEAQWEEDGLLKQRVVFDVEEGLSVPAYVFRPLDAKGPLPAILACHGHGPFGKEPVMGNRSSKAMRDHIAEHNYDFGLQMAQAGFVTMAIDWRGFGERDDRRPPHFHDVTTGRDLCDTHFVRASLLGQTLLGRDVHDGMCAIDYLASQPFVDADRMGVMGLSFGGTMTTWLAICDQRLKAADIICYSDRFSDFSIKKAFTCGSQVTTGLYQLCDVPDLHGLIAPRPLLVEIGVHDEIFSVDSGLSCFNEVKKIYEAAGAGEHLSLDLFGGGHGWGGNKAVEFFRRHL